MCKKKKYSDVYSGSRTNIGMWQARVESRPEGVYIVGQAAYESAIPLSSVILVKPLVQSDSYGSHMTKL